MFKEIAQLISKTSHPNLTEEELAKETQFVNSANYTILNDSLRALRTNLKVSQSEKDHWEQAWSRVASEEQKAILREKSNKQCIDIFSDFSRLIESFAPPQAEDVKPQ